MRHLAPSVEQGLTRTLKAPPAAWTAKLESFKAGQGKENVKAVLQGPFLQMKDDSHASIVRHQPLRQLGPAVVSSLQNFFTSTPIPEKRSNVLLIPDATEVWKCHGHCAATGLTVGACFILESYIAAFAKAAQVHLTSDRWMQIWQQPP